MSEEEIIELTNYIGNNIIQLHSDIAEDEVEKIATMLPNVKLVRLIHISQDGEIVTDYKKMKYADYYLLDSFNFFKSELQNFVKKDNVLSNIPWYDTKDLINYLRPIIDEGIIEQ